MCGIGIFPRGSHCRRTWHKPPKHLALPWLLNIALVRRVQSHQTFRRSPAHAIHLHMKTLDAVWKRPEVALLLPSIYVPRTFAYQANVVFTSCRFSKGHYFGSNQRGKVISRESEDTSRGRVHRGETNVGPQIRGVGNGFGLRMISGCLDCILQLGKNLIVKST